jgi:hypothetical protein
MDLQRLDNFVYDPNVWIVFFPRSRWVMGSELRIFISLNILRNLNKLKQNINLMS